MTTYWICVYSQPRKFLTADSELDSLINVFVSRVPRAREVESVFCKTENARIRVWTVIDEPNRQIENQIYDAQFDLMDKFPEISFDFVVIFRQGKAPESVRPEGAIRVFPRV